MKKLILKLLILSIAWTGCTNYAAATSNDCVKVTISYTYCDDQASRHVGLVPYSHQQSLPSNKSTTIKFNSWYFGENRTVQEFLDSLIYSFCELNEFALFCLKINSKIISLDSVVKLEKLKGVKIEVDYNPANNTPDKIKQRRIAWLADQINESVWLKAEAQIFVENNYMDESGNLRSLRDLRRLWDK